MATLAQGCSTQHTAHSTQHTVMLRKRWAARGMWILALAVSLAEIASLRWYVEWSNRPHEVWLTSGALVVEERAAWSGLVLRDWMVGRHPWVLPTAWYRRTPLAGIGGTTATVIPLWPGVVGLGLCAWALRAKGRREGCCAQCGYELKGLGVGAVCPECGSAASELKTK